jgi:exonuclease VII small subunit
MLEELKRKLAELEAGMTQLQRDRRQLDNAIAMQNGAMAFAKGMIEELEAAQVPDPTATLAAEPGE